MKRKVWYSLHLKRVSVTGDTSTVYAWKDITDECDESTIDAFEQLEKSHVHIYNTVIKHIPETGVSEALATRIRDTFSGIYLAILHEKKITPYAE